ncbi:MAG: ABC transporter ATP-binding protein [Bifidobacteriaceae bacterium]|nr:ABC transporter ATP-binding protein [Bifidobacteriaceae bacterium]
MTDQPPNAIVVEKLTKRFGTVQALNGLDLTVRQGEVLGFLGPNGAGKSTTLRILLGLLRADSGHVQLLGADPWHDAVALHRRLVYVPGDVALWPNLTGGEAIDLLGRLHGGLDQAKRAELCERFDLDTKRKSRTYSKGNRQKVALIAALASQAELLLLDEPTSGLDPLMEAVFQTCIRHEVNQGRTVLLSSHILDQVEALADRVSIIRQGKIVETGSLDQLRHLRRTNVTVTTDAPSQALASLPGVHNLTRHGAQLRCEVDSNALNQLVKRLAELAISDLSVSAPTLEQLLLHYYDDELAAAGVNAGDLA